MSWTNLSVIDSPSARQIGTRSPGWWAWAPRVVAESLRPLTDPLVGLLAPGPSAHPAEVARALAQSLAPPRTTGSAPEWLDSAQADAFRILLHAVRSYGAALTAEPVGSGKTYLALAVAQVISPEPPVCLVPAALVAQWESTAERLGIPVVIWSHSRLSRGRLPPAAPRLVIIDESHHFRHPSIRRYRVLAPWLVGRQLLLLSATPVVNSIADLYHQLHLGLRDDVLAHEGAASLRMAFRGEEVPPALGRFVIRRLDAAAAPVRRDISIVSACGASTCVPSLDGLALSSAPEIAALIRTVLLHAAASSAAALLAALRRYRSLLLHARDALAAGQIPNRNRLRRMIGAAEDQLVLWALLPAAPEGGELRLDDLPRLDGLITEVRHISNVADNKVQRLRTLLEDGVPTLVFVTARETIGYLRRQLHDRWVAWCSGQRAGIGSAVLPRSEVLRWFRPDSGLAEQAVRGRPRTLVTTDVTAEGLDLQAAGRVVHYDLPWTDVRLGQREGRAVRRGSHRKEVEVIRFLPTPALERRLHQQTRLAYKATLPRRLGLDTGARRVWGWRRELAEGLRGRGVEGVAAIHSACDGTLAGMALERDGTRVMTTILWHDEQGGWLAEPGIIAQRLREAAASPPCALPPRNDIERVIAALTPSVRELLRAASGLRVSGIEPSAGAVRLGRRIRGLAADSARRRDAATLERVGHALRFVTGGHTAGELVLIDRLADLEDRELLRALETLPPPSPLPVALRPRLTGLVLFIRRKADSTAQ